MSSQQNALVSNGLDFSGVELAWPGWKWPQRDYGEWGLGGCTVPFVIDANMPAEYANAVRTAAALFKSNTYCIWEERWDPEHFVHFIFDPNMDAAGRSYGLGRRCEFIPDDNRIKCFNPELVVALRESSQRTVVHEMFHALGFHHEHQRPERNNYVFVPNEGDPNYSQFQWDGYHQALSNYDIGSITHYKGGCTWGGLVCGVWSCWGHVQPAGLNGKVDCSDDYPFFSLTVNVGGDTPSFTDFRAFKEAYPPPPNIPPPPPIPPIRTPKCPGRVCDANPDAPCCTREFWSSPQNPAGYNIEYAFTEGTYYARGSKVWSGPRWFIALADQVADVPPEMDPEHWRGDYALGNPWWNNVDYPKDAQVVYQGQKYIALQAHLSDPELPPAERPDLWWRLP